MHPHAPAAVAEVGRSRKVPRVGSLEKEVDMTTHETQIGRPFARPIEQATSRWWIPLIIGILWLIYAFVVLSFTYTTIWAIAIFAGVAFIAAGIVEFVLAAVLDSWQWLHALAGVLCIAAGIVAFVWPGETFLVLAAIIGWFLLFRGTFNIVESLLVKDYVEQWWLILITGILQVAIALWAVGYAGRSIAVLVVWVGAWALTEGVMNIWAAFRLRSVHQQAVTLTQPRVTPPSAPA
jgi:uncharacterized membrane protein HdeD (DUF308 family)